jgi:hypothetical protein
VTQELYQFHPATIHTQTKADRQIVANFSTKAKQHRNGYLGLELSRPPENQDLWAGAATPKQEPNQNLRTKQRRWGSQAEKWIEPRQWKTGAGGMSQQDLAQEKLLALKKTSRVVDLRNGTSCRMDKASRKFSSRTGAINN